MKKKFKFEVLDPTGVSFEEHRHEFEYSGGPGNRIYISVNGWQYYITSDGKYVRRIGPEPEPDVIIDLSKKPTFLEKVRKSVERRQSILNKNDTISKK